MCKFDYALLCAIVNSMHLDWSVFIYIHFTCTDFNLVTIKSLLFWKLLIQMHAFIAILAVIGRRRIVIHPTVSGSNLTTGRKSATALITQKEKIMKESVQYREEFL